MGAFELEFEGIRYEGLSGIREFWADSADVWEEMRMSDAEIEGARREFEAAA